MMKRNIIRLAALLFLGSCVAAFAQPDSAPLPANANVVGSGPIVAPPPPPRPANSKMSPSRTSSDFTQHDVRHLLYVAEPGSLELPDSTNGSGIIVLDANNNYAFIKRIHVWNYAGSMGPMDISGMTADPATNMLYLAARGGLAAIDLATDKLLWSTTLDGHCCERPQVDADGKTLVVGSNLRDYWYKLDAKTGKLEAIIHAPQSDNAHNLNLSADGKLAFMSPNGKVLSIADVATAKVIRTIRFPENIRVQALNTDSSKIYVNQNSFLGYIVADTHTGKILNTVEVTSEDWRKVWNESPRPHIPHGCPSHGIALSPDGKEVWLDDGMFKKIHIFSNTAHPKEIATIPVPGWGSYWLMFGLDGKLVYSSSGDVIDAKTHKVVTVLKSEYGKTLHSEKMLDMIFKGGHLQRVANQFGNQFGDFVTAEKLGVGPHMPVLSGAAPQHAPTGVDPNANVDWSKQ